VSHVRSGPNGPRAVGPGSECGESLSDDDAIRLPSVHPSIYCVVRVVLNARLPPPIFSPSASSDRCNALGLLCSSFTHARATVTSPSQAPTTVLLRKPGLRSAGFVQNCRARAFSLKLHGRREKPSSQISGTGGWLEITDFQNSDTKGGL